MATIVIEFPDEQESVITEGLGKLFSYKATLEGKPNPETQGDFVRRKLANWIRSNVISTGSAVKAKEAEKLEKERLDDLIDIAITKVV